jgi:hypothetical protein
VLLTGAYLLLMTGVQVLALPRFEIPFADGGMCGFGSRDPYWWATLALLAPGLSFAPLGWAGAGARRKLASKATGGLALLLGAVALSWLAIIGLQVAALAGAMGAWRINASGLTHPGFVYPNIKLLLEVAQIGLGSLALALGLVVLALRLAQVFRCHRETLTALRAGLLLLLGAMLTVREAWENDSGCFPLWPAFTLHSPSGWYGLWTTSVGFYGGCLWLLCAAWHRSRRLVAVLVPSALAMIYWWNHGSWSSGCACQAIDVTEQAASAAVLDVQPATAETGRGPVPIELQVRSHGLSWEYLQFADAGAFLNEVEHGMRWHYQLQRELRGPPHQPANVVLRLADDAPLEQVRAVVDGAQAVGFRGITFEFALRRTWTVAGWLELQGAGLTRVPVPFENGCECQLDLSSGGSVHDWLRGPGARIIDHECCLSRSAAPAR